MNDSLSIELAVLGLLHDRPIHGYELYRRYSSPTGLSLVWKVKRSRFYAILARLGRLGLVDMEVREQADRPPRKVFRLTAEGLAAFRAWMSRPVSDSRAFRVEFPAKLLFCARLDPGAARHLVADQKEECRKWLLLRRCAEGDRGFDVLVCRFRAGQLRAMEEWLSDCEAYLDQGPEFG